MVIVIEQDLSLLKMKGVLDEAKLQDKWLKHAHLLNALFEGEIAIGKAAEAPSQGVFLNDLAGLAKSWVILSIISVIIWKICLWTLKIWTLKETWESFIKSWYLSNDHLAYSRRSSNTVTQRDRRRRGNYNTNIED